MRKNRLSSGISNVRYLILSVLVIGVCIAISVFIASPKAQNAAENEASARVGKLVPIDDEIARTLSGNEMKIYSSTEFSGNIWREIQLSSLADESQMFTKPKKFRALKLDKSNLRAILEDAPPEFSREAGDREAILYLPLPGGNFGRFRMVSSPVMSSELTAQYPAIKSYSGVGIDDPTATMRLSWTPNGLNAFVISRTGSFLVTPYEENNQKFYLSYFVSDAGDNSFECLTRDAETAASQFSDGGASTDFTGGTLRQYRMIISGTAQFYAFSGGNNQAAAATINTLINNVNAIYERKATIRFIFQAWGADTNGTIFPPDQNVGQMADINQSLIDNVFGNASYDVGHVLGFNPSSPSGR